MCAEIQKSDIRRTAHVSKSRDVTNNLLIIKQGIDTLIENTQLEYFRKSTAETYYINRDMIPQLQAIYNILIELDDRISQLEK